MLNIQAFSSRHTLDAQENIITFQKAFTDDMTKPALFNTSLFYIGYLLSYLLKRIQSCPSEEKTLCCAYTVTIISILQNTGKALNILTIAKARTMFLPTSRKRTEDENVNVLIWPQVYKVSLKFFKFKDFKITIFRLINIQFSANNCAFPPILSQMIQFFFSCTKRKVTVGLRRVPKTKCFICKYAYLVCVTSMQRQSFQQDVICFLQYCYNTEFPGHLKKSLCAHSLLHKALINSLRDSVDTS